MAENVRESNTPAKITDDNANKMEGEAKIDSKMKEMDDKAGKLDNTPSIAVTKTEIIRVRSRKSVKKSENIAINSAEATSKA